MNNRTLPNILYQKRFPCYQLGDDSVRLLARVIVRNRVFDGELSDRWILGVELS